MVIILDKFDVLDGRMLEWMSTTLNQAFRDSTSFQASRFIFSAQQKSSEISDFFGKFGFEQVHEFIFGGLANPSDVGSIEDRVPVEAGAVPVSSNPLEESNQTIELKSVADSNTVNNQQPVSVEPNLEKAKEFSLLMMILREDLLLLLRMPETFPATPSSSLRITGMLPFAIIG